MTTHAFGTNGLTDADLKGKVGRLYDCGLAAQVGAGSPPAVVRYGYMLEPTNSKDGGFHWKTDVATKQSLIAYSSQQLIDRDLAFYPRVTDADFSKGAFQEVWLDPAKFFDSDLDPRVPGFLQLRAQWARISKVGITAGANFSVVAWNGDFWYSFGEANGNIYSANAGTTTTPVAASILSLGTDGSYLYAGTATQLFRSLDGATWSVVASSINGTASQWWIVNQGTNGYFAYYKSGPNLLYKIDLTVLSYKGTVLADGAQRYYRLGEAAGTVAVDAAGNSNGTYVNAPTLGVTGAIAGDSDTAVTFAAASSQDVTFTPGIGGNSRFSIECWIIFTANPAANQQIVAWGIAGATNSAQLFLDNAGKIHFTLGAADAGVGAALTTNAYHHVVATWDGTTAKVYVDGAAYGITQTPGVQTISNTGGRIAASPFNTLYFNGTVDEVAIYPSALSAIQVSTHFTLGTQLVAVSQPQIPVGSNAINIVDLVEYQTSIAILTTDVRGPGSDAWYFDGNNLTRIIRLEGYTAQGMCNALGALYVGGFAVGQTTTPKLFQVDAGNYSEVVIPGSPFPAAGQSCLGPRSQGRYVYWPIVNPSIKGISVAPAVVVQYDVLTAAASKLPTNDATDFTTLSASPLRNIALLGDNVAAIYRNGTTGILQYQLPAFGTIKYQTSGWLASSHIDFGTPGVVKRFRRLEVHHSPLNAGEQIVVKCFVDQDPLGFTTALAAVPASQFGGTNNVVGSTITSLLLGSDTIGKTVYFAIQLTAGTSQNTSPRVSYVSVEVGGSWVAELNLICTTKRTLFSQEQDDQGASGADLAYLLFLAQEMGANLTFYHRNGQTYTMAIESLDGWNPNGLTASKVNQPTDEEYAVVHAILRQAA